MKRKNKKKKSTSKSQSGLSFLLSKQKKHRFHFSKYIKKFLAKRSYKKILLSVSIVVLVFFSVDYLVDDYQKFSLQNSLKIQVFITTDSKINANDKTKLLEELTRIKMPSLASYEKIIKQRGDISQFHFREEPNGDLRLYVEQRVAKFKIEELSDTFIDQNNFVYRSKKLSRDVMPIKGFPDVSHLYKQNMQSGAFQLNMTQQDFLVGLQKIIDYQTYLGESIERIVFDESRGFSIELRNGKIKATIGHLPFARNFQRLKDVLQTRSSKISLARRVIIELDFQDKAFVKTL